LASHLKPSIAKSEDTTTITWKVWKAVLFVPRKFLNSPDRQNCSRCPKGKGKIPLDGVKISWQCYCTDMDFLVGFPLSDALSIALKHEASPTSRSVIIF